MNMLLGWWLFIWILTYIGLYNFHTRPRGEYDCEPDLGPRDTLALMMLSFVISVIVILIFGFAS